MIFQNIFANLKLGTKKSELEIISSILYTEMNKEFFYIRMKKFQNIKKNKKRFFYRKILVYTIRMIKIV